MFSVNPVASCVPVLLLKRSPARTNQCRYANRAKNIKNKPKINEDPKDAMLREYSRSEKTNLWRMQHSLRKFHYRNSDLPVNVDEHRY